MLPNVSSKLQTFSNFVKAPLLLSIMSINQIFDHPVTARKRKQEFGDVPHKSAKRQRAIEHSKALKSFTIEKDLRFHNRLKLLLENPNNKKKTFRAIGVCRELCISAKKLDWTEPTKIQKECIPHIFLGKDIIALAETGSGKTGAFAIPIIQSLLSKPLAHHSLVISPTRELALQIHEQFESLGCNIGLKSVTIIGGVDRVQQAIKLQKKQHVIIATPGRILDHLITCKGFKLHNLKFLVLDEADRILQSEFAVAIEQIIKLIKQSKHDYQTKSIAHFKAQKTVKVDTHNYQTLLFSATMTSKVARLEKASLRASETVKVEVNAKYGTVASLSQYYLFIPAKHKLVYMVYLLHHIFNDRSIIVFTNTKRSCHHLSLVLHNLNMTVIPLHGEMNQYERMGAVEKFKEGAKSILVATEVAARGLDIPAVTVVVNYDIPIHSKDYVHRVGRTARAGKKGIALNLVTQYDVEVFQRIEQLVRVKMDKYPNVETDNVMEMVERVIKADRVAHMQIKEHKDEIKTKIKELSMKRKRNGRMPRLQTKDEEEMSDDGKFAMDDIDYDDDTGGRSLGAPTRRSKGGGFGSGRGRGRGRGRGSRGPGRGRGRGRGRKGRGAWQGRGPDTF